MENLKLEECGQNIHKDFWLGLPKRFSNKTESKIRLECIGGEWHYMPKKFNFCSDISLCTDELEVILSKLYELNKRK